MEVDLVDLITEIKLISKVDLVAAITEISNIVSLDTVDLITKVDLVSAITTIGTVNAITNIANLQSVDLVDAITNIVNVESIDLIDAITDIGTLDVLNTVNLIKSISSIDAITNIANLESLEVVDKITLIDAITDVGTLDLLNTVNLIKSISSIDNITNVETIEEVTVANVKQSDYKSKVQTKSNFTSTDTYLAVTDTTRIGKFFPRGCRGFLYYIRAKCKDNGSNGGTITVYVAPAPFMGAVYSGTITVPAGGEATDRFWNILKFWHYDSLFIWFVCSSGDIQVEYRDVVGSEGDTFISTDSGATWTKQDRQLNLATEVYGQTTGDVTVSGIVNNIEIPASASSTTIAAAVSTNDTWVELTTIHGCGKLVKTDLTWSDDVVPSGDVMFAVRYVVDGNQTYQFDNRMCTQSLTATSGRCAEGEFLQMDLGDASQFSRLVHRLSLGFRKSLKVEIYQSQGTNKNCYGVVTTNLIG
jgi:hypothetical protein